MNQSEVTQPLGSTAQRVLAEVVAQLERYGEAVQGLCARGEVRHTKHGKWGPDEQPEQIDERLDTPEAEQPDILPLLADPAYDREELPTSHPNEVRIRATRSSVQSSETDEPPGADLMFTKEPPRLVQAMLHPPAFSGIARLFVDVIETEVLFGYINGVPLPVKTRMRMRSKGVGRFRVDQETVATVRFEPCSSHS